VPDHSEGVRNLCDNIYGNRDSLGYCESDKDVYQSLFMRSDLYLGAEHVLEHIAHILCHYQQESVVESMGSVLEGICLVRGGSKTATNK